MRTVITKSPVALPLPAPTPDPGPGIVVPRNCLIVEQNFLSHEGTQQDGHSSLDVWPQPSGRQMKPLRMSTWAHNTSKSSHYSSFYKEAVGSGERQECPL